jgi:hypothetical protein
MVSHDPTERLREHLNLRFTDVKRRTRHRQRFFSGLLVSRIRDSLTKSGDLGEDFVSSVCPDEWLGGPVADGQVLANGGG